jgi:hypothetical protein
MVLSDINGDGLPDLVYINKDNSKEIRVLLSKVTEITIETKTKDGK